MSRTLKESLFRQFVHLKNLTYNRPGFEEVAYTLNSLSRSPLLEQAVLIILLLKAYPYLAAHDVEKKTGTSLEQIALIYKLIQGSKSIQEHMKQSENRDYFNVVHHYFDKHLFTIVFFVGTTCPSRCVYCPNVSIDQNGIRKLAGYGKIGESPLKKHHIQNIFKDLEILKNSGTDILVKISGGLEPLTDTKTMSWITGMAKKNELPVKLFTNGLLLNSIKRRKIALETGDIRISLSTTDEDQYQRICFDEKRSKGNSKALAGLKQSIRSLVDEKKNVNPFCKIGFNSIILPSNLDQLPGLIDLACDLKIDYIDFKPDYFSTYDQKTEADIQEAVEHAAIYAKTRSPGELYINFTGSLNKKNLYWQKWKGCCDSIKQSNHKIFITPYGHCTPVHYGAFPHSDAALPGKSLNQYTIGQINDSWSLSDILDKPSQHPQITLKQLNPFELMLSLEITREEEDMAYGIPHSCNPYLTSMRDIIPETLCSW